jgi:hypothetical protein
MFAKVMQGAQRKIQGKYRKAHKNPSATIAVHSVHCDTPSHPSATIAVHSVHCDTFFSPLGALGGSLRSLRYLSSHPLAPIAVHSVHCDTPSHPSATIAVHSDLCDTLKIVANRLQFCNLLFIKTIDYAPQ